MAEEERNENNENNESKKGLLDWCEEHPKTVFSVRLLLWATFSAILPFIFIAWRYGIFTHQSKIKLTGWGIVAIIIALVFILSLLKYIYKGLKPGLFKQCMLGVVSIILPLIVLYLLVNGIEENIHLFKQALGCVILCEAIGIPLNPFPAWLAKREVEDGKQKAEKISDIFWDKFFKRKKDDE